MDIKKATQNQSDWITDIIGKEFPYTKFTPEKISSKISNPKYIILIAAQKNAPMGFCEMEIILEKSKARLNAIYVEEKNRRKGIAKKMISKIEKECKKKQIQTLFLLVKTTNEKAKALYQKTGFKFEKMHEKIIEGEKIEIWSKNI